MKKIKKQIVLPVLIIFLVLAAGGITVVSAQDDFMDPNESNNEATASIEALLLLPVLPSTGNATIGGGSSILSPSQIQDPVQAQTQAQTSVNTNNNHITNDNVNVVVSSSTATNTNTIANTNTFNPTLIVSNRNNIGNGS